MQECAHTHRDTHTHSHTHTHTHTHTIFRHQRGLPEQATSRDHLLFRMFRIYTMSDYISHFKSRATDHHQQCCPHPGDHVTDCGGSGCPRSRRCCCCPLAPRSRGGGACAGTRASCCRSRRRPAPRGRPPPGGEGRRPRPRPRSSSGHPNPTRSRATCKRQNYTSGQRIKEIRSERIWPCFFV